MLVQLPVCFFAMWLVFGSGLIDYLTVHTDGRPLLEMTVFSALSLVPFFMARFRLLASSVDVLFEALGRLLIRFRSPYSIGAHLVLQLRLPAARITQSALYFVAANLLANAIPESFAVEVPKLLRFLDANGDGTLEAEEIEAGVFQFTSKILMAALNTFVVQYLLAIKRPPRGWTLARSRQRAETKGVSILEKYWQITAPRAGWWTLLDRILTGGLWVGLIYTWLLALGLDPQTVAATGGAGGLALGLAAQNVVSNGVAALILVATPPCKVGDEIEIGEPDLRMSGVVKEIGWNATTLVKDNGELIYVPNKVMLETPLAVTEQ